MYNFDYVKASNVEDAVSKNTNSSEAKYLAGGMTLIPTLKSRLASSDCLIDLSNLGLSGINVSGNIITIKSMTTHSDVANSSDVKKLIPGLANLANHIGDHMVRNKGTIGGSVANNDPSACYPSAILALNASIKTNKREIKADEFFTGMFETSLDESEIITDISFTAPQKSSYAKFPNPASRYAMVGVFVAKYDEGVRVAVTGASQNGVFRSKQIEDALSNDFSTNALDGIKLPSDDMLSDIHAKGDYRAHLIVEMAKRAVNTVQ